MAQETERKNPIQNKIEEILKKKKEDDSDDDPNFIKKDDKEAEGQEDFDVENVINKLKNVVWPESNQQRNLDRETGGLEVEKRKEISIEDIWDGRSEEVDLMGSTDTFNSTGVRSFVARKKRERLERAADSHQDHIKKAGKSKEGADQPVKPKVSFVNKIRLMRDHGANSVHNAKNDVDGKDNGRF